MNPKESTTFDGKTYGLFDLNGQEVLIKLISYRSDNGTYLGLYDGKRYELLDPVVFPLYPKYNLGDTVFFGKDICRVKDVSYDKVDKLFSYKLYSSDGIKVHFEAFLSPFPKLIKTEDKDKSSAINIDSKFRTEEEHKLKSLLSSKIRSIEAQRMAEDNWNKWYDVNHLHAIRLLTPEESIHINITERMLNNSKGKTASLNACKEDINELFTFPVQVIKNRINEIKQKENETTNAIELRGETYSFTSRYGQGRNCYVCRRLKIATRDGHPSNT